MIQNILNACTILLKVRMPLATLMINFTPVNYQCAMNHTSRHYILPKSINNFKTWQQISIYSVNKFTLGWNNLQKYHIKQNFQMMKRSDLKTNIKNYFLKQYNVQKT